MRIKRVPLKTLNRSISVGDGVADKSIVRWLDQLIRILGKPPHDALDLVGKKMKARECTSDQYDRGEWKHSILMRKRTDVLELHNGTGPYQVVGVAKIGNHVRVHTHTHTHKCTYAYTQLPYLISNTSYSNIHTTDQLLNLESDLS